MYITNPCIMQSLYIHTDEQTAAFVIADDKISTIYLTRHQYFSYLKLFAAKCQYLWCLSTVSNALYIILHLLTFDLIMTLIMIFGLGNRQKMKECPLVA